MSQPAVNLTELDGALGALPTGARRPLALVGVATAGPLNTPAMYAGSAGAKALATTFGAGPTVEAAARAIALGVAVVFCRTGASVPGSYVDEVEAEDGEVSALDLDSFEGSSVATVLADPEPDGAYSVQILFPIGGTIGVAGIVYQVSKDAGQTWSMATALGTDDFIEVPGIGTVTIEFAAGTVAAGDLISFTTTAPIPASAGELVTSLLGGTSVPTVDGATAPNDSYEVKIRFITGGTVGTTGITYVWSLDGGRTESSITDLLTDNEIVLPGSGGVKVDLGAGTIIAGATIAFPTVEPKWNNTELGDALQALRLSKLDWEICKIVGAIDSTSMDVIELKFSEMLAAGKDRQWIGHVRNPVGSELAANYSASILAAFASKASILASVTAGAAKTISAISSRSYRRPLSFTYAPLVASVSEHIDVAELSHRQSGLSIRDVNGNPDEWDESITPGLGVRFVTARTWEDEEGVYINNPVMLSPAGSDFEFIQHRRVMNLGRFALRRYFRRRLSKPIYVSKKTGFILEQEAVEIEHGASTAMKSVLQIPPSGQGGKASAARFILGRTDNILSTKTLTGTGKITPLAYPKFIDLGISFENPAMQIIAV